MQEPSMFDCLVIGKGLFGAAAAKYLSREMKHIAVIGPDEPRDAAAHNGVFASHYDQGRLAGRLGRGVEWTALAYESINAYRQIEAESGIRFYTPVGRLHAPAAALPAHYVAEMKETYGLDVHHLSAGDLEQAYPYLRFPGAEDGWFEKAPAGYINPRALIRAQLTIAERQGAEVIRDVVTAVAQDGDWLTVHTGEGGRYRARKVLIAAGAFSNYIQIDGGYSGGDKWPLPLRLKTETILLAETPQSEAERLGVMPAVSFEIESAVLDGIYLLPPLLYPDGRYYVKMGCDTAADRFPQTLEEVTTWFRSGESDVHKAELVEAMLSIIPDLEATAFQTGRCIVTYTTHGLPYIDEVITGRVFAAVGGNGTGAKSSDAIGRLAARRVISDLSMAQFEVPTAH
ncbi:MAG: NAD(P)/FAD-dependent oxidoreductase [Candidatus Promineifilaceae bacterium]